MKIDIKVNRADDFYEKVFSFVERDFSILTFNLRLAKFLIYKYRLMKLKNSKIWKSPEIYTMNFFVENLFKNSLNTKNVLIMERAIFIFVDILKNHFKELEDKVIDLAFDYYKHFDFLDTHKLEFKENNGDDFIKRNEIFEEFKERREKENLLSYGEILKELKDEISKGDIKINNIVVIDEEEFCPIEKEFISFLSDVTDVYAISSDLNFKERKLFSLLYKDQKSELDDTIEKAFSLKKENKSVAIVYFDEKYKEELEKKLFLYENKSKNNRIMYSFDKNFLFKETSLFKVIETILTLYEGVIERKLFSLVSAPSFKNRILSQSDFCRFLFKNNDRSQSLNEFVNKYFQGGEILLFLKDEENRVEKFTRTLLKILKEYYSFYERELNFFNKLLEYTKIIEYEIGELNFKLSFFSKLFLKLIERLSLKESLDEFVGINILNYENLLYHSYDHLFLVGVSSSVLPRPFPKYPLFTNEEKESLNEFNLEEKFKKEENYLKKVFAFNENVVISRAAFFDEEPTLKSPLVKFEEIEVIWEKYHSNCNRFLPQFYEKALNEKDFAFSESFYLIEEPLQINNKELSVTREATSLVLCPFKFFCEIKKIREPQKISLLMDAKKVGSIMHEVIKEVSENISLNDDDLKRLVSDKLNNLEISELEKISLFNFIFGHNDFWGNLLDFLRERNCQDVRFEYQVNKELTFEDNINVLLRGKVDRLEINDNSINIIDYKFKKSSSRIIDDLSQLYFYKKMLSESPHRDLKCFVVYLLSDFKIKEYNSFSDVEDHLNMNIEILKSKVVPAPYKNSVLYCRGCAFELLCHREKFLKEEGEDGDAE